MEQRELLERLRRKGFEAGVPAEQRKPEAEADERGQSESGMPGQGQEMSGVPGQVQEMNGAVKRGQLPGEDAPQAAAVNPVGNPVTEAVRDEWAKADVRFAASPGKLEGVHDAARHALLKCIVPSMGRTVLHEGGAYAGCWMESTGTINAELLARFVPSAAESTYLMFAEHQREDGQLPYKVTPNGPAYRQIQMVTPLARCVWHHYRLNGRNREFLREMYQAMAQYDEWLVRYRDTRGTGCVEAFGTFDTGHDLSPRFWHAPDTPYGGDARSCDPDSPILPYLAPDLTANVYCQRLYLALMAEELGEDGAAWREKAEASLRSLYAQCYDEADGFFYDRDRKGVLVRIQSDLLLRVLACEVGDAAFFEASLRRYLLNTRKFFAKYPFTSISMDDPRFDPFSSYNSWAGPSNLLTMIRTPHAFERHGRYVELTWVLQPLVSAMSRMKRFAQTLSPWTGEEGYTDTYSPAILGVLDFVERLCGILPTGEGELWFTGLLPSAMDHGETIADSTAYGRTVDGVRFEQVNSRGECLIYRDGEEWIRFPYGLRVVTDRRGRLTGVIGMTIRAVEGIIRWEGHDYPVRVKGNERLKLHGDGFVTIADIGVVTPAYC